MAGGVAEIYLTKNAGVDFHCIPQFWVSPVGDCL